MRASACVIAVSLLISGCSSLPDFGDWFGDDAAGQAEIVAAEAAKTAGENSAAPEKAVQQFAFEKVTGSLANRMSAALSGENSRTRISITGQTKQKTTARLMNITALGGMDGKSVGFVQSSILYKPDRSTLNVGLGRRMLSADEKIMFGVNTFLDYAPTYGHQRASLGVELKSSAFELNANQYARISDWEKGKNSKNERVMDGQEIEIGAQLPYVPAARLFMKSWKWSGTSTVKGKTYSLELDEMIGPGIRLEAGVMDYDGSTKDQNFVNLSYNLNLGNSDAARSSAPLLSARMFEVASMRSQLLDEVRRNNEIIYETEFQTTAGGV